MIPDRNATNHARKSLLGGAGAMMGTLAAAASLFAAAPAPGQEPGDLLVSVEVSTTVATVHSGERFALAIRFNIEPGWHIYWRNAGETGAPTGITVAAPESFRVGRIRWPRPQVFTDEFISYGYEEEAVLFVPILAVDDLPDGEMTIDLDIDWLVCMEDVCHLGAARKTVTFNTTSSRRLDAAGDEGAAVKDDGHDHADSTDGRRFDDEQIARLWRDLPRNLQRARRGLIETRGDLITLSGPALGHDTVEFIPDHSPGVTAEVIEKTITEDKRFRIVLRAKVNEVNTLGRRPAVGGAINLGTDRSEPSYEFTTALRDQRRGDRAEDGEV